MTERNSETQAPQTYTIDEVRKLHEGKWVLMRVVEYDEFHAPARGEVISAALRRSRVMGKLRRMLEEPEGPYFFFRAGPTITDGESWRKSLRELEQTD